MQAHDVFWNLAALSDRQLLDRMTSVLGSSRRLTAELIAHLGEVEERRLHLLAACSSMFAYCLKLGMTEDEAYRRIEVARLARRYPAIFPLLVSGQVSISAVALLKHHLTVENHLELLAAATGKSVGQTRELIAARFPRPDVASSVRKLPERHASVQPALGPSLPTPPCNGGTPPCNGGTPPCNGGTPPCNGGAPPCNGGTPPCNGGTPPCNGGTPPCNGGTPPCNGGTPPCNGGTPLRDRETAPRTPPAMAARVSSRIEPLAAQRYKVQLTAGAELARKLELARDLMRHSHPDGELGPIVERALDLLIESLMRQRFGKKAPHPARQRSVQAGPEQQGGVVRHGRTPNTTTSDTSPTDDGTTTSDPATIGAAEVHGNLCAEPQRASASPHSPHIPRGARRAVVERDGLGCSWVDERGVRCASRAWLEYDHRHPRAKGGGSEPDNLRLLCRAHNRFAAEREYGRKHVERTIAERRRQRAADSSPAI